MPKIIEMKESSTVSAEKLSYTVNQDFENENENLFYKFEKEFKNSTVLSSEDEKLLAERIKQGDEEAKKRLIEANLKLVLTLAKKTIHVSKIPVEDLIQEGNLGLMTAVEKFNPSLGFKFSTYASWWIKQAMFKAISEQGYCIKIPVYIQETLSKYSKVKAELERKDNKTVTSREVAKKMNIEPDKIDLFLSAYSKSLSLDSSAGNSDDGKDMTLGEMIEDENSSVEDKIELAGLKSDIYTIVSSLQGREQDVVKMRFGLNNTEKMTLEEIGNLYGVTKECIRQTEMRAIKKMRISGADMLASYLY